MPIEDPLRTRELAPPGAPNEGPDPGERVATRLGPYVLRGEIGRGGMGRVLRAYDARLDREVALKVLRPAGRRAADHEARIIREAQALARLSHPNVVEVYDVGRYEGELFIAMEYVPGDTLARWLERSPRDWRSVVDVFVAAGRGLEAAHAAGLVHRDFKPSNVLIGSDGRVRVTDFGLAREAADSSSSGTQGEAQPSSDELTQAGTVMGTPAYMAPEQHAGGAIDPRTDQYGFCVALYEALVGRRPFVAKEGELASVKQEAPPPEPGKVPGWLARVVLRGLSPSASERFSSMTSLLSELESGRRRGRRSRGVALAALSGIAVVIGVLAPGSDPAPCSSGSSRLGDVWSDARREDIGRAFARVERGFAGESFDVLAHRLDAWASTWASTWQAACEASEVGRAPAEDVADARMQCLERDRHQVQALVEVLAGADADELVRTLQAVLALPDPARCMQTDRVLAELPMPDDPIVAAEVAALRLRIAEIKALQSAGRYDAATKLLEGVRADAEPLGHAPLHAELSLIVGDLQAVRGEDAASVETLQSAFFEASRAGADSIAAAAALKLAYAVGYGQARHDEGLKWAAHAEAIIDRARLQERRAALESIVGSIHWSRGDLGEAERHYQRALELWTDEDREHDVAVAIGNIAGVRFQQGRYEEAATEYRRAIDVDVQVYGENHPKVALGLANLGASLHVQGRYDEALKAHERALAIRRTLLGPEHPDVATSLDGIASTMLMLERKEEAEKAYREAADILEHQPGGPHPDLAATLGNLGLTVGGLGRTDEAVQLFARALTIIEEQEGADSPRLAAPLMSLGAVLLGADRLEEAEKALRRSWELRRAHLDAGHPHVATSAVNLAEVVLKQGRATEAVELYRSAVEIRDHADVSQHDRELARLGLARALAAVEGD